MTSVQLLDRFFLLFFPFFSPFITNFGLKSQNRLKSQNLLNLRTKRPEKAKKLKYQKFEFKETAIKNLECLYPPFSNGK